MKTALLFASLLSIAVFGTAAATLSPQEASQHVGQTATVCGSVTTASYRSNLPFQPTFLNFGEPYPHQLATIVILGNDRAKFGAPEADFNGKRICVTGFIRLFGGKPQIVVTEPNQISR